MPQKKTNILSRWIWSFYKIIVCRMILLCLKVRNSFSQRKVRSTLALNCWRTGVICFFTFYFKHDVDIDIYEKFQWVNCYTRCSMCDVRNLSKLLVRVRRLDKCLRVHVWWHHKPSSIISVTCVWNKLTSFFFACKHSSYTDRHVGCGPTSLHH